MDRSSTNVDELIKSTTPQQVARHIGFDLPEQARGELRIRCVFCEEGDESTRDLAINLDKPHNPVYTHCCGVRGNLLMLMYGMVHGEPPESGRLQGAAFNEMKDLLVEVNEGPKAEEATTQREASSERVSVPAINTPLEDAEKEAARELATLYEDFITDPQAMKPAAAQYVRRRPWMTPDVMKRWRVGWIPGDGRSMFRKNFLVYAHLSETDEVLSYSGRDLHFEGKDEKWERDGRPADKEPSKHRFVKGYRRGLELYGQHRSRLTNEMRESLSRNGLVVVSGPNDVIRLDALGIAAVGLWSNTASDEQIAKIVRFASRIAAGRVWLMPDCDSDGEDGCKELLWKLAQHEHLTVRPAWSGAMHDGHFAGRKPESITDEEFGDVLAPLLAQAR